MFTVGSKTSTKALPSVPIKGQAEGRPLQRVPRTHDAADIARIIKEDGGIIVTGVLSERQLKQINGDLDGPLDRTKPGNDLDLPEEIKMFHGANTRRLTGLLNFSDIWREEILEDDIFYNITHESIGKHVGDCWISANQMMEIGPGNRAQALHRDFTQWWPNFLMPPTTCETMLNFLIATTKTTDENGATRVIGGSHLWPYSAEDYNTGTNEMTYPAELEAGDMLIIGGRIVHGGGYNRTSDNYRRIISLVMVTSAFTQEEAFSHTVPMEQVRKLSPRLQKALGFRSQWPKDSPGLWTSDAEELGKVLGLE